MKKLERLIFSVIVVGAADLVLTAAPVCVGAEDYSAALSIEWSDGYVAEFVAGFSDPTISGLKLLDLVEASSSLVTERGDFSGAAFIDGITYEGHSNIGYGGGEDWWHYWLNDGGAGWVSPAFGVSDRVLSDGAMDGWVYGRTGPPVPEPLTMLLFGVGGLVVWSRRK